MRLDDIAAAANVSPRTFGNYFSNKYEAICALAVDRARRVGANLLDRPTDEPLWDAITHAVLEQYAEADQAPQGWAAGVRLLMSAPVLQGEYLKVQAAMRDALAEAIAEQIGAGMRAQILAGAVISAVEVGIDRWLAAEPPVPVQPLVAAALQQLADDLVIGQSQSRNS